MLITRLDARVALILVALFSVGLFLVDSWLGMIIASAVVILFLLVKNPQFKRIIVSLIPLYVILGVTFIAHIPDGVLTGLFYVVRLFVLAVATIAVAFGYDDTQLVRAFASLLSPLRRLKVPVDDIATMFSIALRFIPVSMDEVQRVYIAQKSRCAAFDEGTYRERISKWGNVFVPVIVGLFRRADNLAEAMESRCYSGNKRSSLHKDCVSRFDWAVLVIGTFGILCAVLVF